GTRTSSKPRPPRCASRRRSSASGWKPPAHSSPGRPARGKRPRLSSPRRNGAWPRRPARPPPRRSGWPGCGGRWARPAAGWPPPERKRAALPMPLTRRDLAPSWPCGSTRSFMPPRPGAADAVAVAGLDAAVTILRQLKAADAGSTALVIAGGDSRQDPAGRADVSYPPGVLPALDLVKAPGELYAALSGLLAGVVVAADLDDARHIVRAHPE